MGSWQTFWIELSKAWAWPLVVFILLFFYKDIFLRIIQRLNKIRLGDKEINLSDEIREVVEEAEQLGISPPKLQIPDNSPLKKASLLVEHYPTDAMLETFIQLEAYLKDRYAPNSEKALIKDFRAAGIKTETIGVIERLRGLGRLPKRIKGFTTNTPEASDYLKVVQELLEKLDSDAESVKG